MKTIKGETRRGATERETRRETEGEKVREATCERKEQ